jgi:hypothetical protein
MKEPSQNIAGEKRAGQQDADSDYLLAKLIRFPAFQPFNTLSAKYSPFSAELPDSSNRAFYRKQLSGWCYRANRGKGP